jgi:hypothetical protein
LTEVIEQPSGGGNEDIDATTQRGDLRIDADAAKDDCRIKVQIAAIGGDTLADLCCQFARGGKDKGANTAGTADRALMQALE